MPDQVTETAGIEDAERAESLEQMRLALMALFGAHRRLRGRDARIEGGVSFAHYALLAALQREGELSAGQLAAHAALTPATVTQMLESLSATGIVERTRSEQDRRVVTTRLTPEGRRRVERKEAELSAKWRDALAAFDPDEIEAATRVVVTLGAYLDGL